MKRFRLSRRATLRGLGLAPISIALPTLEAMLDGRGLFRDARGQAAAPKLSFLTVFIPNGVYPDAFWPSGSGTGYTLSRCLMPLSPYKADFNLYRNLRKDEAFRNQNISTDAHDRGHASFATGGCLTATGVEFPSVDQVAADKLGGDTKFRSLPVALGGVRTGVATGQLNLSWTMSKAPLPPERNPAALFSKLFGMLPPGTPAGMQPTTAPAKPLADYTKSILDYVRADVTELQPRLGARDKARLDEHLNAIRDLEKQIITPPATTPAPMPGAAPAPAGDSCTTGPAIALAGMNTDPPGIDDGKGTYSNIRAKALIQLQVMAFACGLTRFGSFQLGSRVNKRQFAWLGATDGNDGHHGISHDSSAAGYEKQAKIVTDEIDQFAYMLKLMKESKQGDRDLLYNSIIFFAAEHGHGEAHDFTNVPVILAGQAGGKIATGKHVVYRAGTKYANMFVTILNVLGVPTTKFGALGDGMLTDVV